MNGIEKITGQIEADVQREIDDLTAQAQAQAAEILADYEARARAEAEATLKRGALAAAQREERLGDMARLEARKLTLGTKQEMVERAFQRALEKLTSLPDAEYVSLLANLAAAGSRSGHEAVIFSQKDRARFGKQVVTLANDILARKVAPKLPEELTGSKAGAILDKVVAGASAESAGRDRHAVPWPRNPVPWPAVSSSGTTTWRPTAPSRCSSTSSGTPWPRKWQRLSLIRASRRKERRVTIGQKNQ